MKILYVGGVWHGLFLLDKGEHEVRVPVPAFANLSFSPHPSDEITQERTRADRYIRRAIGMNTPEGLQMRAEVMVCNGADLSIKYTHWALAMLLYEGSKDTVTSPRWNVPKPPEVSA